MKKSIISVLALGLASGAYAGTQPIVEPTLAPDYPLNVTAQVGIMYQTVGNITGNGENFATVPSLLYGGSLGVNRVISKKDNWSQLVGISAGFYTGNENGTWDYNNLGETFNTDCTVIPVMGTYDVQYDLTGSVSVFAGGRAGIVTRWTEATGNSGGIDLNDDSKKVLPVLGVGFGVKSYLTENWTLTLSVDCTMTIGKDCDNLFFNNGYHLRETTKKTRIATTVSVGLSYTF